MELYNSNIINNVAKALLFYGGIFSYILILSIELDLHLSLKKKTA